MAVDDSGVHACDSNEGGSLSSGSVSSSTTSSDGEQVALESSDAPSEASTLPPEEHGLLSAHNTVAPRRHQFRPRKSISVCSTFSSGAASFAWAAPAHFSMRKVCADSQEAR